MMRTSLLERPDECELAIGELDGGVDSIVAGEFADAALLVVSSDRSSLTDWFIESQTPSIVLGRLGITAEVPDKLLRCVGIHSAADSRAVYERDGWRCRFCACRVIDPAARRRLQQLVEGFRWGRTNRERHGGVIVHMASTDHVLPRAWGGTNDHSNLVTACWPCQFSRSEVRIDECNISDPFDRAPVLDDWDGLRRILSVQALRT